jgi:hypothetical protein
MLRQLKLHQSLFIGRVSPALFNVLYKDPKASRCSDTSGIDFYGDGTLNQINAQD